MAQAVVQRVVRETFLAGQAECGVCGAWVRDPAIKSAPNLASGQSAVAAICGVCGVTRYFELI